MTTIIPVHERESCFRHAKISAKIDFVRLDNPSRQKVPRSIAGVVKHHGAGFTVHDPTPDDLHLLRGFKMIECEFAIDLKPPKTVLGIARYRQCCAIHQHITSRIWPFDAKGVQRSYRVSPAVETAYEPYSVNLLGEATDPRLPDIDRHEVEYIGHKSGFIGRDHSLPNFAQVRIYYKTIDQRQVLPEQHRMVRMEVTIDRAGLEAMNLNDAVNLVGFRFRPKLALIFRMLKPDAASVSHAKPRLLRRQAACPIFLERLRHTIRIERLKLVRELAVEGGLVSLMNSPGIIINTTRRDESANRKIGSALDNMSKRYATHAGCTS